MTKKLSRDYNLAVLFPEIAKEWHPSKNGDLKPNLVFPKSRKKVWWICSKKHEFESIISNRTRLGRNCPYCSNQKVGYGNDFQSQFPEIAKEWNYKKNDFLPSEIFGGSDEKVWWICKKNHEWKARIANRCGPNKAKCPYCSGHKVGYGNDLKSKYPDLMKEWNFKKNKIDPKKIAPMSHEKVWWICSLGHEYPKRIYNRTANGQGCNICFSHKSKIELFFYCELLSIFENVKSGFKYKNKEIDIFFTKKD